MREEKSGLDCLDLLEETPSILRGLRRELNHDAAEWKPAAERFSVAEVLAHLSHSEGHCYRMRLDRFMSEETPEFEPDDASVAFSSIGTDSRCTNASRVSVSAIARAPAIPPYATRKPEITEVVRKPIPPTMPTRPTASRRAPKPACQRL